MRYTAIQRAVPASVCPYNDTRVPSWEIVNSGTGDSVFDDVDDVDNGLTKILSHRVDYHSVRVIVVSCPCFARYYSSLVFNVQRLLLNYILY